MPRNQTGHLRGKIIMLIIWKGWGILVVLIVFVAFVVSMLLDNALEPLGLQGRLAEGISLAVSAVLAAVAIWFVAMALASGPTRRLVDPASGEQFVIRRDAGSLFFIPTRFWAFIVLGLGLLLGAMLAFGNVAAEPTPAQAFEAQSL